MKLSSSHDDSFSKTILNSTTGVDLTYKHAGSSVWTATKAQEARFKADEIAYTPRADPDNVPYLDGQWAKDTFYYSASPPTDHWKDLQYY